MARLQQCFTGNAANTQACATKSRILIDTRNVDTQLSRTDSSYVSGWSTTEDDEFVFDLVHGYLGFEMLGESMGMVFGRGRWLIYYCPARCSQGSEMSMINGQDAGIRRSPLPNYVL